MEKIKESLRISTSLENHIKKLLVYLSLISSLFLYKEVLKQELDLQVNAVRAKRSKYLQQLIVFKKLITIAHETLNQSTNLKLT